MLRDERIRKYELRGSCMHGEGGSWNRRTSSVDVQVGTKE